jgi:hypothetical protein
VPVPQAACEVRLPDGVVVRLPENNLAALATALQTLRSSNEPGGDDA